MKRLLTFFPVLLALLACLACPALAQDGVKGNGCPYYITVDRSACVTTVYGLDQDGFYTQPVRSMICSVGRQGHATPLGTFSITGSKKPWCYMLDGSYGQYSSQFRGNYLFHSICYRKPQKDTLMTEEYNMLGQPASLGCVRLQTADAKWIYDNCAPGTLVTIFDGGVSDPSWKPERLVNYISPEMDNGWDPTDPDPDNPWPLQLSRPRCPVLDQSLLLNGAPARFQSCIVPNEAGQEEMYVRLRSLALMLESTSARFQVGWDGRNVTIQTGGGYTPDGSEWLMPAAGRRPYETGELELIVDGVPVTLEGVLLQSDDGKACSYFKLQDLESCLGFRLGWDEHSGTLIEAN